jgi:hypothetical protein
MLKAKKQNQTPVIDDHKRQLRLEALRKAEASLRIEGLFLEEDSKRILNDWVNGLISDEERNQLIRKLP